MLVEAGGEILAMVVFDWWTHNSAEGHVCIEEPSAILPLLRKALRYFFLETGRSVLLGRVRATNTRALALDKGLGFREVHRIKDGYAVGEDMVLLEMRREDCRWLEVRRHGD